MAYTFFALEALSDEIEAPIRTLGNDWALMAIVAMRAIVAGIDASLRELLDDVPPSAPLPDEYFILDS